MNSGWIALVLVGGCAIESRPDDVVGPFTGTPRRYVVDSFTLPMSGLEARALGADLNGDGTVDNQLGMAISTFGTYGDITTHADDMIASGVLASSVIVVADDSIDDPSVSVTYVGSDGAPATAVGGTFENSVFVSNRTATTQVPGAALLRLPVFVDIDPIEVPLFSMQMTLRPAAIGFDAEISGTVDPTDAFEQTYDALVKVVAAEPSSHRGVMQILDANHDFRLDYDEVRNNSIIQSLFYPDLVIGGRDRLSLGFHVHLSPCDDGSCITAPPDDTCFDRVKDGAESDVDCGGGCRSCKATEACTGPADCESGACDAGSCRAPTCFDGVRDGFETDIDCGGTCELCSPMT
jgi:hypothetical protein